jgi:hypothetical protein
MDYTPHFTIDSAVLPGVSYTLHRMTVPRRAQIHAAIGETLKQIREIQRERKPLDDEYRAAYDKATAAAKAEVDKLVADGLTREEAEGRVPVTVDFPDEKYTEWARSIEVQRRLEKDGLGTAYARALLVSIAGFTIGGAVPSLDQLIAEGPPELVDEIAEAAQKVAELSPSDRGNLLWPGTSKPPGAGPTTITDATSAEAAAASA